MQHLISLPLGNKVWFICSSSPSLGSAVLRINLQVSWVRDLPHFFLLDESFSADHLSFLLLLCYSCCYIAGHSPCPLYKRLSYREHPYFEICTFGSFALSIGLVHSVLQSWRLIKCIRRLALLRTGALKGLYWCLMVEQHPWSSWLPSFFSS